LEKPPHESTVRRMVRPFTAREAYDAVVLVDDRLERMRQMLVQAGRCQTAVALGGPLKGRLAEPCLDRGICHMDLTLDNVHWPTI
jgi:hypothetical protein